MKPIRLLGALAAASAALFALSASKCESETEFIPFVKEICNDGQDNDQDGSIDCKDTDCALECAVHVSINPLPAPVKTDTFPLAGTHTNATAIIVYVTPAGTAGTAVISGNTWTAPLSNLSARQTYNLKVIGSNGDLHDTETTTFIRGD